MSTSEPSGNLPSETALQELPLAAIWDLDGVLVDSEPLYVAAEAAVAAEFNASSVGLEAVGLGRSGAAVAAELVSRLGLPITPDDFLQRRNAHLKNTLKSVPQLPGADALVAHCERHGLKNAVATSSSRELLAPKQAAHPALFNRMNAVVCADDVPAAKPSPALFLEAARRLEVDPARCIVFEDAPAGVEAAAAAGMPSVALQNPAVSISRYRESGARYVVEGGNLEDFDCRLICLPSMSLAG